MATIDFKIKNIKDKSGLTATVAAIDGSIDATSIQQFQSVMDKLVERGVKNLILDCAKVSYINSTGLGTLLKYADAFDGFGGHMAFIRVPNKVLLVMEMLGFNALFSILADEAAALESFSGTASGGADESEPEDDRDAPHADAPSPAGAAPSAAASTPPGAQATPTFPLTVQCAKCRVKLNVEKAGQYRCPRCGAILKVEDDGRIRFFSSKKQKPVECVLPCDDEIAVGAGDLARSCAISAGMNDDVPDQIAEAVTDTCINVIERALNNARGEIFHLMIQISKQGLVIRVADSGETMQFDGGDITQDEGFGAVIDRMDTVEHTDNGGIGNLITLIRKF